MQLKGRKALLVASSDLSHYPAYDDARASDHAVLAAVYDGYTDGLDLPDMLDAKALLDELSGSVGGPPVGHAAG